MVFPCPKNFPKFIVIHRVKGFGTVNKEEIDAFLDTEVSNWLMSGTEEVRS